MAAAQALIVKDLKFLALAKLGSGDQFRVEATAAKTISEHLLVAAPAFVGDRSLRQIQRYTVRSLKPVVAQLDRAEGETRQLADLHLSATERGALTEEHMIEQIFVAQTILAIGRYLRLPVPIRSCGLDLARRYKAARPS